MKRLILIVLILFTCTVSGQNRKIAGKLNFPGALFTYTAQGKGIPCVALTGSENIGHNLIPEKLKKHFIIIHADPVNMDSTALKTLSLDDLINDIDKLRASLGLGKIAVWGHSMFGLMPLEYAVRYPGNISYAIISGSPPAHTRKTTDESKKYWDTFASDERKKLYDKNVEENKEVSVGNLSEAQQFINWYNSMVPYIFYNPHFDANKIWENVELNMHFINHFRRKLASQYNSANYKNANSPVIVFAGKCDFSAPYYLWDDFKNTIPGLTLKVYENAGHNPMMEIPKVFCRDLWEWIENNPEP